MDSEKFKAIYSESRNGANQMYRHGLCPPLIYSDGVRDLAETGCYWLLDIVGTEVIQAMGRADAMGVIEVTVADSAAVVQLSLKDDAPPAWCRGIEYTDMPAGRWTFYITYDGLRDYTMILPSEY